jgi:hypothetical protein
MEKRHSPEDSARRILALYAVHHVVEGNALAAGDLAAAFVEGDPQSGASDGLNYALEHGWLKHGINNEYFLTHAGAAET